MFTAFDLVSLLKKLFRCFSSDGCKTFLSSDQAYSGLYPAILVSGLSFNLYVSLADIYSYPVILALNLPGSLTGCKE